MTQIAQLFESALRSNRSSLLRQAAERALAAVPVSITLRELLAGESGPTLRELTLDDLAAVLSPRAATAGSLALSERAPRRVVVSASGPSPAASEASEDASRDELIYRRVLEALAAEPRTIGQLAKLLGIETEELRGYLGWMKRAGKVVSTGRARATRYQLAGEA